VWRKWADSLEAGIPYDRPIDFTFGMSDWQRRVDRNVQLKVESVISDEVWEVYRDYWRRTRKPVEYALERLQQRVSELESRIL